MRYDGIIDNGRTFRSKPGIEKLHEIYVVRDKKGS